MRHAEPGHIWVTLAETGDGVDLRIRDDGAGFDTTLAPPEGHFGTIMMRERALVAGGSFAVESRPGHGTTVTAHFPEVWIQDAAEEPPAEPAAEPTAPADGPAPPGATGAEGLPPPAPLL